MTRRPRAPWAARSWLLWVGVGLLALVVPVGIRVAVEGQRALVRAQQAEARGDVPARIEALGQAARWTLPAGLGSQNEALAALEALAHGPDVPEDVAIRAHRQVRRALLGTRAWGVADRERLAHANRALARVTTARADDGGQIGARYLEAEPAGWRANLAGVAFAAWVVAGLGFVRRGLDARMRLRPASAVRWGLVWVVSLLAWVALTRAGS